MNANMANKLLNTKHMIHTSLQVKDTSILCSLSNMSDIGASMIRVTYGTCYSSRRCLYLCPTLVGVHEPP